MKRQANRPAICRSVNSAYWKSHARWRPTLSDLLRTLRNEGMTIVLVEHDMEFVMNLVDRIVVMDFGAKLAEGLPAEIRADARVQEAYLGGVV